MEDQQVATRVAPEKVTAVYTAYAVAMTVSGTPMPPIDRLPELEQRRWWEVANAIDQVAEATTDTIAPYDYELSVAVEPIKISETFKEEDGSDVEPKGDDILKEALPTTLHIRPFVASDMCLPEFDVDTQALNMAMRARVHGVDVDMLEWRIDLADADAAHVLVHEAGGTDAWSVMREAYWLAGGEVRDNDIAGWRSASYELLSDDQGEFMLVRCKTPGLGTLKVGPIRAGHERIWSTVSAEKTEWDGRLAALEKLVGKPLREARIEDVDRLWTAYQVLAKKKERQASERVVALRSSPSTDGPGKTSKTKRSPS